jgi:hypothetical protein
MTPLVLSSFLLPLKPLENLSRAFPSNDIMSESVVIVLKAFDCATQVELSVSKEKGKGKYYAAPRSTYIFNHPVIQNSEIENADVRIRKIS